MASRYALIGLILTFVSGMAHAEYIVTGDVRGNVCSGFVIKSCEFRKLSAVKGDDGKLYELAKSFGSVDEYKSGINTCWIHTKSTNLGLISWGINTIRQPVFYEKTKLGKYEELDVDYVVFKCLKK